MSANPDRISASSRLRVLLCLFLLIAAGIAAVGAIGSSRVIGQRVEPFSQGYDVPRDNAFHRKIAPWVIEHTAGGQQAEFFVVLADQADLSGAASLPTKAEKGRYVYKTLLSKSQTTQAPILQWLNESKIEYQSFYIINAILVKCNL